MSFKEFIISSLKVYFILVTLICLATFLLGSIFAPETKFGYEAFVSPLVNAFLALIPEIVMLSRREMSMKEIYIRKAIQLLCIEFIMVYLLKISNGVNMTTGTTIGLIIAVFFIFVLTHVIMFILDTRKAKDLNEALSDFQKNTVE